MGQSRLTTAVLTPAHAFHYSARRTNPAHAVARHCDLSWMPTDIEKVTPRQRADIVRLMSEQPLWWLKAKRASLPALGTAKVQKMADEMFVESMVMARRRNPAGESLVDGWWATP